MHVIAELDFDPPITEDELRDRWREAGWCRDLYGVRHVESYLSGDGRRLLCVWDAPDAETVRQYYRTRSLATRAVWAAEVHGPDGPLAGLPARPAPAMDSAMVEVLVERSFEEPANLEELHAREDSAAACLEAYGVTYLHTFVSSDARRMVCLYDAPDAEAVRSAEREAGMPFDRVWSAAHLLPQDDEAAA